MEDPKRKKSCEPEGDRKKSAAQKIGDGIRKWIKKEPKDQRELKEDPKPSKQGTLMVELYEVAI